MVPGTQGVARRHSTAEAGELASEDPVEGRALPASGLSRGEQEESFEAPASCHRNLAGQSEGCVVGLGERCHGRVAKPLAEEPYALMRARTDLWEAAEATPPPTRPQLVYA